MKLEKEGKILPMVTHYENSKDIFKDVTLMINIHELTKEEMKIIRKGQVSKIKMTLEYQEPILDEEERKYLSGVIRPFRDKIKFIKKYGFSTGREYIHIETKDNDMMDMFPFKKGTMYKNLELNKEYSLKDLDL